MTPRIAFFNRALAVRGRARPGPPSAALRSTARRAGRCGRVPPGRFAGHVSALLGHGYQSRAITERYITANPEGLRPATDAIAGEIARLLGLGGPAQVVAFPQAAGARQ